jgi:phosphopantetheinyl transferase
MISIINNPNSTVGYFKQDDYEQLIAGGVNKRAVEKGGIQTLLEELGFGGQEICYRESGQPYFKSKPEAHLSVSHAKGWFAVAIGSEPVGIDIQTHSPKLIQGQDYFRNARELPFAEDEKALHLIWGAKEAFYKLKEGKIADLKEDISLLDFDEEHLVIEFGSERVSLKYLLLENAYLVFTS